MYLYRPPHHIVFVACSTNEGEGQVNLTGSDVLGQWADVWRSGFRRLQSNRQAFKPEKHRQDYHVNCLYGCDW